MKRAGRIFIFLFIFLFSGVYFFLVYIGYTEQHIDLNTCDKINDVIAGKGLGYHYSSKGSPAPCYYIKLEGTGEQWGVYRRSQRYDDLAALFQVGDSIIVYGKRHSTGRGVNIDLIQVNRPDGEILLDKKEYEKKESALIYIGVIGGIFEIGLSYYYLKRKILNTVQR